MNTKNKHSVTNYPVGDFLIRVKNAAMAKNKSLEVQNNKKALALSQCLKKMGYVEEITKKEDSLILNLTFKNKKPRLMDIKLVSKPGLRIYMEVKEIEAKKGPSPFIISSSKGIISSKEAVKSRHGGEVIAEIW